MKELILFVKEYSETFIIAGFLFGIGFHVADQIIWFICDLIKERFNIPLG